MVRATARGAAIEGEKIKVQTRKFDAYPPKRHPHKGLMWQFGLGIRSSAEITEAYTEPNSKVVFTTSLTALGDEILGTCIDGWSRKPLGEPNISKGSASHSASHLHIYGGCYACVEIPPREHLDSAEISAKNPPIEQKRRQLLPP